MCWESAVACRLAASRTWSYGADHRADKRKNAGRSRTGIAHRSLLLRAVEIQFSAWRNYRDVVLPKYFGIVGRGLEGFVSCGAFPSGNFPLPDKGRVVPIAHEYDGPKIGHHLLDMRRPGRASSSHRLERTVFGCLPIFRWRGREELGAMTLQVWARHEVREAHGGQAAV